MIALVSMLVAASCAAASARRVWLVAHATAFHPDVVADALERSHDASALEALSAVIAREPQADWERDLLDAMLAAPPLRTALVNEQLTELDYRIQRWARVPRVCASIATSFGFMLATLVFRNGLADPTDLATDAGELLFRGLVGDALTVVAMGVVGTAFCVGAQGEAKRLAKARTKGADRLVELLESRVSPNDRLPFVASFARTSDREKACTSAELLR